MRSVSLRRTLAAFAPFSRALYFLGEVLAFQIKQISEHGTSNPIVARLSVQTSQLLNFSKLNKEQKDKVLGLYNSEVQPRLLECDDISQQISSEILEVANNLKEKGFVTQSQGRVIEVPNLLRLEQRLEQFLYCAKSALRDLSKIFNCFFETDFNEARYDKILKWASKEFGEDSDLAKVIKQDHDLWIKQIVSMRNAVEHPGGYSGYLHIDNFVLVTDSITGEHKLNEPCWYRNDEPKNSIAQDLLGFVSNFLELCEELLVINIKISGLLEYLQVVEIPEDKRDKDCAIRLQIIMAQGKI
jgi:hypothetical protein